MRRSGESGPVSHSPHVSRKHLILKHRVALGSASGIVESDQLSVFYL
jgi:hypothetical protein